VKSVAVLAEREVTRQDIIKSVHVHTHTYTGTQRRATLGMSSWRWDTCLLLVCVVTSCTAPSQFSLLIIHAWTDEVQPPAVVFRKSQHCLTYYIKDLVSIRDAFLYSVQLTSS